MNEDIKSWDWFKDLVKRLRKQQEDLMREQGGGNQIMLAITLVAYDLEDWVVLNPHSINLHTGKTNTTIDGKNTDVDVKYLFLMQRLSPVEE